MVLIQKVRSFGSRNKYGAVPTVVDGVTFASGAEARRYGELLLLQKIGEIHSLECQPRWKFEISGRPVLIRSDHYKNGRQASFSADFRYWDCKKKCITVEDVKGGSATRTEAYALRRAIVEAMYPGIRIIEVRR